MAALSEDRNTPRRDGVTRSIGVAGGVTIYAGALVARDANGYATPGAEATTILGIGRAEAQVDNSGGADGAVTVEVSSGVFRFANDSTTPVTDEHIGTDCYIMDDQTVSADGTNRSVAGTVFKVDSDGVWVKF